MDSTVIKKNYQEKFKNINIKRYKGQFRKKKSKWICTAIETLNGQWQCLLVQHMDKEPPDLWILGLETLSTLWKILRCLITLKDVRMMVESQTHCLILSSEHLDCCSLSKFYDLSQILLNLTKLEGLVLAPKAIDWLNYQENASFLFLPTEAVELIFQSAESILQHMLIRGSTDWEWH